MLKCLKIYVTLNLIEYSLTFLYFITVSIFYTKFHSPQGYCRVRRTYMMVIWMYNVSIQIFGLGIVYGKYTDEIINDSCMKENLEDASDECIGV